MKTKLEHFAFGLILAPLAPLALFMAGGWGAYEYLPEKWIPFGAIGGLLLGILADIFLLQRLVTRAYKLGTVFWVAVFLFYTVGIFGVFMGVPIFNAALAIPVGFVIGGKLVAENADKLQVRKATRRAAWFTTGVMAFVCIASATLALMSSSTAYDLQGLIGLGFEVSQGMILGLILVGGMTLLVISWGLTVASVRLTRSFLQRMT
ncbi:MAG: hypothetical protein ABIF04_07430 [Chloroflexota bacterium]